MDLSKISDKTIAGKLLRAPLKILPSSMQMPILRGPLRGKKWIVGSGHHGCWLGSYEFARQRIFGRYVKPGSCVYDLGANVGFYSLMASVLAGAEGRVFSFEPLPRNLAFLRKHLELNSVRNCFVLDVAVARSEGLGSFGGPDPFMGHLGYNAANGFTVRTVGLDELVSSEEIPPPNVIKCDIEGGEFEALSGAHRILSIYAPTIFLSIHGTEVRHLCLRLLVECGYQITPLDQRPLDHTCGVLAIRQQTQQ